jgi:hypothetical protein
VRVRAHRYPAHEGAVYICHQRADHRHAAKRLRSHVWVSVRFC